MEESLTPPTDEPAAVEFERRVYVPHYEGWTAHIKTNWDKDYCYTKNPGEDYFHLLLCGEVYLVNAEERLCLNCAKRRGVITDDRLYWQRGVRRRPASGILKIREGEKPRTDSAAGSHFAVL